MSSRVMLQQPRDWSEGQLRALAAMGVPLLRARRPEATPEPASGEPAGWSAADRNGKLAAAMARALGIADHTPWAALAEAGALVPAAEELRASADAKRRLWRQIRTWLARRAQ
jgi:hypothetical protein